MRFGKIVLLSAVWMAFSASAGFYRTEQADGGWRVLDPEGKPITVLAIEKVKTNKSDEPLDEVRILKARVLE